MCEPLNNLWTLCQVLSEQMGIRAMSATVRLIKPWHNPKRRSHILLQYNQDFWSRVYGTLKRLFREWSPRMGHLALSPLGRELFKAAVRKPAGSDTVCLCGLVGHKIPPKSWTSSRNQKASDNADTNSKLGGRGPGLSAWEKRELTRLKRSKNPTPNLHEIKDRKKRSKLSDKWPDFFNK